MDDWLVTFLGLGGWLWLSIAVLFLIGEILSNTTWLMWLGVAAGITAVAAFVVPGLTIQSELVVFAGASLASTLVGRRYFRPVLRIAPEAEGINAPAGRLAGARAVTATDFVAGAGQVRHGDTVWQARDSAGGDLPGGVTVEVVAVEGATLVVRRPS